MAKTKQKPKSVDIELKHPIEWGDETISTLTLRRPTAEDISELTDKPTMGQMVSIALKCAGQPNTIRKKLDAEDAMELVSVLGDFLGGGHGTT